MEWTYFGGEMNGIVNEAKIWSQIPCAKDTEKKKKD